MTRRSILPLASCLALLAAPSLAEPPAPPLTLASAMAPPISGVVRSVKNPVAGALVVLYNVADTTLARMRTASDGTFVVASAPIGVYDLIAYKKGFLPALVRIWHQAAAKSVSSVEIELASSAAPRTGAPAGSTLWELQDRIPADVLREIQIQEGSRAPFSGPGQPRLDRLAAAEVRTVAGVANDASLARTSVGLTGGLANGWRYGLRGEYNAVLAGSGSSLPASTTGNTTGFALDVEPSAAERVELTTRRHSIRFGSDKPASFQSHAVTWSRGDEQGSVESVAARYVEEANLYRADSLGASFFPLSSRAWEVRAGYRRPAADGPGVAVAMAYRHREGTVGPSGVGANGAFLAASPDADLSASTTVRLSRSARVEGGVVGRYVAGGYGIAPRLVARYEVGNGTYLFIGGLYRVAESGMGTGTYFPRVASIEENAEAAARHGYSVGLERSAGSDSSFRVEASEQQMDELVRAFFEGDFLTDFDSVYLLDGNTLRQYQATGKHRFSRTIAGSVAARYGEIDGAVTPGSPANYGISDSRGRFWSAKAAVEVRPTRTGIALVVRGVRQTLATPAAARANDSDKVSLSLAQDLSVIGVTPFGSVCKLLVAIESARSSVSTDRDSPRSNRFLGGVALSF